MSNGRTWMGAAVLAALLVSTAQAGTYDAAVLADNPISYWRFEEADTSVPVADSGASGTVGTYNGITLQPNSFNPGLLGKSAGYSGGNGSSNIDFGTPGTGALQYLTNQDTGSPPAGDPDANRKTSVEYWIKTTQTTTEGDNWRAPTLFGEESGGDGDIHWGYLRPSGKLGAIAVNDANHRHHESTALVNDGNWHHIAVTYDWSSGLSQLYFDGVYDSQWPSGGPPGGTNRYTDSDAAIRYMGWNERTDRSGQIVGEIDEVAIYDTILTAGQVSAHYNSALGPVRHEVGGDNTIGTETLDGTQGNETSSPGITGARVVKIIQNKPTGPNPLQLNEVQAIETGTLTNVARSSNGGVASQSSQLGGFGPGNAIDNNLNNFQHTNDGQGEWWQVEFASDADLDKLTIYSRTDCCSQDRTANIQVQVFGDVGLTNMLFDQQVLGIGTNDVRDVPFATLLSADLTASLNPFNHGAGYTYVFELSSNDQITVDNPDPNIFHTILDLNNADIVVESLGALQPGEVFQLLSADQLTGQVNSLTLPSGIFAVGDFNLTGAVTNVSPTGDIPEPITLLAVGLSLTGLGGYIRRRRKN